MPNAAPAMTAVFAIVLLLSVLSAAALYSLVSVAVTRRTREIGIRLAIGASPRDVLTALFGRVAAQVGIGLVLGDALLPPVMHALGQSELRVSEVVPVMLAARRRHPGSFVAACLVVACSGAEPTTPIQKIDPVPASISLSETSLSFAWLGEGREIAATVKDQDGRVLGLEITWTSTDTAVATVSNKGTVLAWSNGAAEIVASTSSLSARIPVSVQQAPAVSRDARAMAAVSDRRGLDQVQL